MTPTD